MSIMTGLKLNSIFEPAPEYRICLNVGSIFDMLSCIPIKGKWGNTIMNGGLWNTTSVVGPNNSFKSTLSKYFLISVFNTYEHSNGFTLDTEISGTGGYRYNQLALYFNKLRGYDFVTGDRWAYVTNSETYGDDFWDGVKGYLRDKTSKEHKKSNTLTTPMVLSTGEYAKAVAPTIIEIDSLSQLTGKVVEEKFTDLSASDGKRNMEDMANAKVKSKIIRDMPVVLSSGGGYSILTAHVGEKKDLDQYNPSMKKFQGMSNNKTVKYIPEQFLFNMNNLYEIVSAKPLLNQTTKGPEYPKEPGDEVKGDTDLMELIIKVLRGKGGSTDMVFPLLCSQVEGVLGSLSDFYLLKCHKFGIDGNNTEYVIDLYPDCKLRRTTVRQKIDNDPKLRRALRLQADLLLMMLVNKDHEMPKEYICSPKELYKDLKDKGYDWEDLLNTVNEWHFREEAQELPTLTIYDLLNMRAGVYTPYWHQPEWKKSKPTTMEP